MIKALFIVGTGSFIGGVLRYAISTIMKDICRQGSPWGTLVVNLIGCLVFGIVSALFGRYYTTSHPWCLLLTTGICGGFTTFSPFAHESILMLQEGDIVLFSTYVAISVIGGISLIALGYFLVR